MENFEIRFTEPLVYAVIAQPATAEELKMIVEKFAVSLQPAEIIKCVSHIRDRARACISVNGAWLRVTATLT